MVEPAKTLSYFIQIAVAMLAGVWYVGAFLHAVQNKLMLLRKLPVQFKLLRELTKENTSSNFR
jgi:hypothetical protein